MPANGTSGFVTVTAPDNVYTGTNDPVIRSIASVDGADVGKFENLVLDKTPVSTAVTDEPGTPGNEGDLVKVTITADQVSVAENVKPTFTVHINAALDHDLVVTLSNNEVVTIKAGETSAPYSHDCAGRRRLQRRRRNQPGHQVGRRCRRPCLREPAAGRCGVGQSHRYHR
ncbi:immunoglobulin-like domain-containing protein [Pseudomonas capeferrum]|uniref:immunoglobulin-like domain-containing protein n=1 Tax=Pseudomonas capeferrum TaxID=1495066 RepID=UPI003B83580F